MDTSIIQILQQYGYVLVFLGAIIAGESFILAASFLAVVGFFNIYIVAGVSLAGILLSDNVWYLIGRDGKFFIKHHFYRFCPQFIIRRMESTRDNFKTHYKKILIFSKYIYGLRIISLVSCGYYHQIKYKTFFIYNLVGNLIWLALVVGVGYFLGFSWTTLGDYNEYLKYIVIFGIIAFFVVRYLISKFLKSYNNVNGN